MHGHGISDQIQVPDLETSDPRSEFTPKVPGGPFASPDEFTYYICKRVLLPNPYYVGTGPVSHCRVRYLIIGCMSTPFQYLHYASDSLG